MTAIETSINGIGYLAMGVLVTLLVMSVLSIAITIDRGWALRTAIGGSRRCAGELHVLLRKHDWRAAQGAAAGWHARRAPLGTVVHAGLVEWMAWMPAGETMLADGRRPTRRSRPAASR